MHLMQIWCLNNVLVYKDLDETIFLHQSDDYNDSTYTLWKLSKISMDWSRPPVVGINVMKNSPKI